MLGMKSDLDQVLAWLEREYHEDGERGFWCNRNLIRTALERGDFYVIRDGDEAVAFQLGHYAPSIANVRKDKQQRGYGTALLEASIARAVRDDVNVLDVECSPPTSLTFWQKHGFERYGDMGDWGRITARRVLNRTFELPADALRIPVTVTFYPERVKYSRGEHVEPIAVHHLSGARLPDGVVMLERRVIGLDQTSGNLVIKIEVDGEERYFDKAKYDDAEDAGVRHDMWGDSFYVDAIEPNEQ
jgi:GNAT superfamily N-acetyltransferase